MSESMLTTQAVMAELRDLKVGNPAAAEQHPLTPGFQFGGVQQEGTKGRLEEKKVLVYGGGDVWPKFIMAPLLHLGVKPENITIVDLKEPPEGLEWQYEGINFVKRNELDTQLKSDPDYLKKQGYDFAVVATSPSAHGVCAKEAIENGLPVMIEKPMFSSTKQYDEFTDYCGEKGGHVYAIDWQRGLSIPLYATLGQEVPFADSINYTNQEAFKQLKDEELVDVKAIFNEGRGNALADISHRGHLLKGLSEQGGWACGGMLADMGIHPIHSITGAGLRLEHIDDAFFGGPSDERGYRQEVARNLNTDNEAEMFARVDATMSLGEQKNIPVHFECGKGSAPNLNDMRTIFTFKSGKTLVQEFGHRVNTVTLYDKNKQVLATASDRGEPYERMFLEASALFDKWSESCKGKSKIVHGDACREAIRVVEESHRHACKHPFKEPRSMRQYAIDEGLGEAKDAGDKASNFQLFTVGQDQFRHVCADEVIPGSCQRHANAEGATFDKQSGNFYYVDNELGLLGRYNPNTEENQTWRLASDELDADGRPKQMLSVARVNQDGSVIVLLSRGGPNAGLNYFNPEKGELHHLGRVPEWEAQHPDNRPNDETTLTIDGKHYICYGTMDKHWDKKFDGESQYQRNGAYYLIDPATLESHKIEFEEGHPAPIITNGLADGGNTADGKKVLFWAETVENPGQKGEGINVYRGELDPKICKVSNIETFKTHAELSGMMNGTDTYGRPDGAQTALYHDREVYGISMLELGQIKFYYSNPKDPEYKKEALRIELPSGMTRNTQFALGQDAEGHSVGLVTTQDGGHFSRRWQVGDKPSKAKDGLNGSVIAIDLPEGLKADPQTIERTNYPAIEQLEAMGGQVIEPIVLRKHSVHEAPPAAHSKRVPGRRVDVTKSDGSGWSKAAGQD